MLTSRLYDASGATHYNYFRDYDPSIGRYVESDPIGLKGGLNTYGYATSSPLSHYDSTGLFDATGALGRALGRAGIAIMGGGGPENPIGDAIAIAVGVGSLAYDVYQSCKQTKCDPPEGTMCYRHDFGHGHADVAADQSHFHFYVMERIPSTGQCLWKEKFGSRGHVDFAPRSLSPCSSYASWTAQYGK